MDGNAAGVSRIIQVPTEVKYLLSRLNAAGFEGYCVGGCVRDSLLGKTPEDWDIATDAKPEEMKEVFSDLTVIPTGVEFGTVTVRYNKQSYEITTYRVDSEYSDSRHPDFVEFTPNIEEDLARRDFTMNAVAYHPSTGLVDPFNGQIDAQKKIVRCVGNPAQRFREDPLRILRGFRFVSTLGHGAVVDEETKQAMKEGLQALRLVAAERIRVEIDKALLGENIAVALLEYDFIVFQVLPWLAPMKDFPQNTKYHSYTVWEHTAYCIQRAERVLSVRLALLYHDAGKPETHTVDEKGVSHFHGHAKNSAILAKDSMRTLRYSNQMRTRVVTLVEYHDATLYPSKKSIKRWMSRLGNEALTDLIQVQKGDALGKDTPYSQKDLETLDDVERIHDMLLQQEACVTLEQLAVSGYDIIRLGVSPGPTIGALLNHLLTGVINETLANNKEDLLSAAEDYLMEI